MRRIVPEQVFEQITLNFGRLRNWLKRGTPPERALRWTALGFGAACVGFVLYCWHVSADIERRFSGRRWSIPSKVFSDTALLFPGERVNRALFSEKLKRLGYREVPHRPAREGEMRTSPGLLEVFVRGSHLPSQMREGFPARITFNRHEIESISNMNNNESVPLLELEREEIALLFGPERERRQLVSIEQVPQHLINAVLSAEDKRFYEHRGVDPRGIARAVYANIRRGAITQGGSTITQQLAKCYFLYPDRTIVRKLREMLISLLMELKYEKSEILEIYLNEIYLGQKDSVSINGVGEASFFYFGKPVSELSLAEAASLAGLIRAPNHYSPYVDKEKCLARRNDVLRAMHENGWLASEELDAALAAPVRVAGAASFGKQAPYFVDYLKEQLASLYSPEDLASLGLSIFTTLDTQVQMAAEQAIERGLARLERANPKLDRTEPAQRLQGAVIVMQPKTGYILAMVGGREYAVSQFNRATQARRQPGSAFKPFVFLAGLDDFTPISKLSNMPVSYEINGKVWEPQNFEPMPEDSLTVREALAESVNLAAVDLAMRVGLDRVVNTAGEFGFSTPLKPYPSLALGALEVVPLELARAYCAFAADGVLSYPLSLKEVVDEEGESLERRHMTITNVTSPEKAFIMTSMLRSAVTDGTARSLANWGVSFPVAGKTGTTNDFRDAWFVGYTPRVLALIWVGFDDGTPLQATGSTAALPIWADLMASLPQYASGDWFRTPPGVIERTVCLDSGEIASWSCRNRRKEVFLEHTAPDRHCSIHRGFLRRILEK